MQNPYIGKPDYQFWRRSVAGRGPTDLDPVVRPAFTLGRADKVATAGSCFAQHIARTLRDLGFCYMVTEDKPAFPFSENENYGTFPARYGNIYTTRQLLQLFRRAHGLFEPNDVVWRRSDGRCIDPFRPRIQAAGFRTVEHMLADREAHFQAVRQMFEELDAFIFTLGLTEGWEACSDGAVFPLAPGVVAGEEDAAAYAFHNFTVAEMEADLGHFVEALLRVNPTCRILLTVSPVALIATYEDEHVLTATTYSKAALRVVAETITKRFPNVGYFPSYEIVTGPQAHGAFFAADLREVTPEGVAYVMSVFARHYLAGTEATHQPVPTAVSEDSVRREAAAMAEIQTVICDEEQIETQA